MIFAKNSLSMADEVLITVIAVAFVLGLVFLSIMAVFAARGRMLFRKKIISNDYNVRIYTLDYDKCLIYYFDRKDMKKVVTVSFDSFYSQFSNEDSRNVKEWIMNIIEDSDQASDYLEVSVILNKKHAIGFSLYELTSIDRERKLIHFESRLLPSLSEHNKKHNIKSHIKRINDIQSHDEKHRLENKGAIILIKFFSAHSFEIDEELVGPLMIQLVNHLASVINEHRYIINLNPTEVAIYDQEASSRAAVGGLASKVKKIADSFLSISSYDETYVITIGIAIRENKDDVKTLVGHGREMAIIAEQKEDVGIELYDSEKDYSNIIGSGSYREIVSIIRNKTVRYYFKPILNTESLDIESYLLLIEPYGTQFDTFNELLEDAHDLRLAKPILKSFLGDALEQVAKTDKVTIFIDTDISYLDDYISVLEKYSGSNIEDVLCFDEDLLVSYNENYEDLEQRLPELKNRGYKLGLIIDDENQPLSSQALSFFDYFLVGDNVTNNIRMNDHQLARFRTIIDIYSRLKGTIVATSLKMISDAEIADKLGVHHFGCSEIADASSNLEVLDSLQKEKVVKHFGNK